MEHRLLRSEASEAAMVDDSDASTPPRASDSVDHGVEADMITQVETRSYGARLRMIILLSLICWGVVIAGVRLIAS